MESSLPYHEPSITTIVILTGFLLLLNIINFGLDRLVYCGLIGQVFLGIAWGTPGAKWLSHEIEVAVVQLGYIGLILLVYEGGLATSFKALKANLGRSTGVALTGLAIPIGLSFLLQSLLGATPLQAFASGAALCSTSLGTTFTILGTSGLSSTRLGVVLTSAAMMDDVVGLIMVQVVSNIGDGDFDAITIVRPILVSVAFAVLIPIACRVLVKPVTLKLNAIRENSPGLHIDALLSSRKTAFAVHTLLLLTLVVGGTFAGTSALLAAYIAGATISWWDSEVPHPSAYRHSAPSTAESMTAPLPREPLTAGVNVYDHYYKAVVENVLKPFFFASIGFSVPITKMFSGPVVWKGIVYSVLMMIGKLMCGLWLVPFTNPMRPVQLFAKHVGSQGDRSQRPKSLAPGSQCGDTGIAARRKALETSEPDTLRMDELADPQQTTVVARNSSPKPEKPISLYPACILAFGMVARGEIGFLIAALAESKGILGRGASQEPSELFLVVTWAISLCTIVGPICIGLLVSRVKQLEIQKGKREGQNSHNVLGAWGVA